MNNYTIEKNGLLKIEFSNDFDCDDIVRIIIDSYEKYKSDRILVVANKDCTCENRSVLDQYDTGNKLAKHFLGKSVHIAVSGKCKLFTRFTETVAINRGLFMKVTDDDKEIMN